MKESIENAIFNEKDVESDYNGTNNAALKYKEYCKVLSNAGIELGQKSGGSINQLMLQHSGYNSQNAWFVSKLRNVLINSYQPNQYAKNTLNYLPTKCIGTPE